MAAFVALWLSAHMVSFLAILLGIHDFTNYTALFADILGLCESLAAYAITRSYLSHFAGRRSTASATSTRATTPPTTHPFDYHECDEVHADGVGLP